MWLRLISSTRKAAISALALAMVRPNSSTSASSRAMPSKPSSMSDHLLDLVAQRLRVERFDDVAGDARLLGGNHVFRLALGGHHDEGRRFQPAVGAHLLQQLKPGHRRLVPVAD